MKKSRLHSSIFLLGLIHFILQHSVMGQPGMPKFIKQGANVIEYGDTSDVAHFLRVWDETATKKLVILHLGDSHLQNENFPNKCRNLLQNKLGNAGIGLIQPFSVVRTYDASFYKSTHTGTWLYSKSYMIPPKLELGVRGMTALTRDSSATFTITFKDTLSDANSILSVFFRQTDSSFVPRVFADTIPMELLTYGSDLSTYRLKKGTKAISLALQKESLLQSHFMLYGMSLSGSKNGVVWHNAGVGASCYKSILYEAKYSEQAAMLNPDLVIIDFGTNDFLYKNKIPVDLRAQIDSVISKVRSASPGASILLTSAQDMLYKKKIVTASGKFSALMRQAAIENHCAFWDWYSIAGGKGVMKF